MPFSGHTVAARGQGTWITQRNGEDPLPIHAKATSFHDWLAAMDAREVNSEINKEAATRVASVLRGHAIQASRSSRKERPQPTEH